MHYGAAQSPVIGFNCVATRYCQGFGKQAQALGNGPLGPDATRRLYDYDCVAPAEPAN